jgi:pimeloyl-ACP methyl ester carboxylesterase
MTWFAVIFLILLITMADGSGVALAGSRDRLTVEEMFGKLGEGPVGNHYFLPMGDVAEARHELSARLVIPETERFEFGQFPTVTVEVFTSNGRLIPVTRDILNDVRGVKLLNTIFSPGRVWSEPGDAGYSRASFPFTLTGLFSNRAHNGIASFLYDDTTVSTMVFQIVQETSVGRKFDAWGAIPVSLDRGEVENRDRLAAEFADELEKRLPVRPMAALAHDFGKTGREVLARWPKSENESVSGLVLDGTIYVTECKTRHGPYPYCDEMRHGVQSVTKSLGGLFAMLRLARKYGDQVFDLRIKDYLTVTAPHDGWDDVTFADALNMARPPTSSAENSRPRES